MSGDRVHFQFLAFLRAARAETAEPLARKLDAAWHADALDYDRSRFLRYTSILMPPKSTGHRVRSRSPAAQHEHRLQLYEDEAFLVASVATFLGGALAGGDVAVAIATAAHRARIEGKLRARAIDVTAATAQGRYVALDAETLLGTLMVASEPDARRFEESVGRVIAASAAAHPQARLHAFGEMVAILGYGRDQDRERARAAGFDHHLVKPVEPDALDALIARVASPQAKSSPATVH